MNDKTIFIYKSPAGTITFRKDSPFWITDDGGLSSVEIDISASRSAMQIGSTINSQSVKPRVFTLDGAIFDPVESNRAKLLSAMVPQMGATLTVINGNESWFLEVSPEKTPYIEGGVGVQHFQAKLYAAYPYFRSSISRTTQIAGLEVLFQFPFNTGGTWWISRFGGSYYATVINSGNVPMNFKATFVARGVLEEPELYHMGTRQRIFIKKEMVAGEKAVVSTEYGKKGLTCIDVNGVATNGFRYLSIDSDLSMQLLPGENLLRIGATVSRENLSVLVEAPLGVKSGV